MKIVIQSNVYAEFENAFLWYQEIDQELADRIDAEFDLAVELIAQTPARFSKAYKQFRRIKLKDFPYYIYYQIHQTTVVVTLFIHTSRNPRESRRALKKRAER